MADPNNPTTLRLAPYAFPVWALFLTSALLFGCVAAFAGDDNAVVSAQVQMRSECLS